MKETIFSPPRVILAFINFLFLSTIMLNAQTSVRIKERVTIEPMQKSKAQPKLASMPMSSPTCIQVPESFGTCEAECGNVGYYHLYIPVWYGSVTWIQSSLCCGGFVGCFDDPACSTYDVIEGADYVKIDVGNHWVNCHWTNPVRATLTFDQREPDGDTAWVTIMESNNGYCYMPGQITYIVVRPQFSISASIAQEVRYGEQAAISVDACNQCGSNDPALPSSVTYSISITDDAQYGTLLNTVTNEMGTMLQGLQHEGGSMYSIAFVANGAIPNSVVEAKIRVSASDSRIQAKEMSIKIDAGCPALTIVPDYIKPGDTATVKVEKRLPDNTLVPYSSDKVFKIRMNNGEQYGRLLSDWGYEGSDVIGPQPFKFIAADSLDVESATVEIQASIWDGGGGDASSIGTLPADTAVLRKEMNGENIALSIQKSQLPSDKGSGKKIKEQQNPMIAKDIIELKVQLAPASSATGIHINTPRPLVKRGPITTSLMSAGTCELPVAYVTIVKEQECFYIKPARETITIGDTTLCYVMKGNGAEIPAGQTFDIDLIGPEGDIGALKTIGGQPSTKLTGVILPVIYIAPSSINGESINVRFLVSKSGGVTSSISSRIEKTINDTANTTDNLKAANNLYIQAMLTECPNMGLTVTDCPTIEDYIKTNYSDKGLPDPRKKTVTFGMFYVEQKNDNVACTEKKTRAGTTTVTLRPEYYEFNMIYLVYYVTDMCFDVEWGYCIENLKEMYGEDLKLFVEADIPHSEEMDKFDIAKEMYQSLSKFKGPDESSQGIQGSISYYPLSEIDIHEHVHIGQDVVKLMELYNEALTKIWNIKSPPKNWCSLDIEEFDKLEEKQRKEFIGILDKAKAKWESWTNNPKVISDNEKEAYDAGFNEVKRLKKILVERFPILESIK